MVYTRMGLDIGRTTWKNTRASDGHAVFKVQRTKRQQKSRHKTDQPCLRFFWKVMLVGYVTAESQNVQPRRV